MSHRWRVFWVPALSAAGAIVVCYGLFVLRALYATPPALPADARYPDLASYVLRFLPFILAGAVGALVAWRLGAQRWERLVAGVSPAVLILCGILYYAVLHAPRAPGYSPALMAINLIHGVSNAAGHLLIGTLPFLLPRDSRRRTPAI